jgi:hypothetical protein
MGRGKKRSKVSNSDDEDWGAEEAGYRSGGSTGTGNRGGGGARRAATQSIAARAAANAAGRARPTNNQLL